MSVAIQMKYEQMRKESPAIACIFMLQAWSGTRITEVLNIRLKDIISDQEVIVKGLKGSQDRYITTPIKLDHLRRCLLLKQDPFILYNRFMIYRFYKRYGILLKTPAQFNNKVTHSLRYDFIMKLREHTAQTGTIQNAIGHKSKNTTEKYITRFDSFRRNSNK